LARGLPAGGCAGWLYKQTQSVGANRAKRSRFRPPRAGPGPRRAKDAKRTQSLDCGIRTDLRRDASPAAGCLHPAEDKTRKTNPIPGRRDTPAFHCSIIPPFQSNTDCAKRTQFAVGGQGRPSSRPKGLAMPPVLWATARNKANCSPGRARGSETCETNPIWRTCHAKQSKLAPAPDEVWGTWDGGNRAKRTQFRAVPGRTRPPRTRGRAAKRTNFEGSVRCHEGSRGVAVLVSGQGAVYNVPGA
jgi:hypothetical protein